jgi:dihydroorotate dehydrogenase electron transfer subunit
MNIEVASVISNERAYEGARVMWLRLPSIAAAEPIAGQFLMIHCSDEGKDPMFARAFSIYRRDGDRLAILYTVVGKGTAWLYGQRRGDEVTVYGPLGRGIEFPAPSGNVLLIGGGVGVAPLVDAAELALTAGHQVTLMMGGRTSEHLLPASAIPQEAEYVVATDDGSAGQKGVITGHLGHYQEWASRIYACGPTPMFRSLADKLRGNGRRQRPRILMEENMPCGWGMCYGCAIFTKRGVKLCCKDGPLFNLFDVF